MIKKIKLDREEFLASTIEINGLVVTGEQLLNLIAVKKKVYVYPLDGIVMTDIAGVYIKLDPNEVFYLLAGLAHPGTTHEELINYTEEFAGQYNKPKRIKKYKVNTMTFARGYWEKTVGKSFFLKSGSRGKEIVNINTEMYEIVIKKGRPADYMKENAVKIDLSEPKKS